MEGATLLRPLWRLIFRRAWFLSLVLFCALGALRAYGLHGPPSARALLGLNFLLMWFLPVVFLTKSGQQAIGLKRVEHASWLIWGLLLGIVASLLVFWIGFLLYGQSPDNWYVSVLRSYAVDAAVRQMPRIVSFFMYTIPAMLLSPVGEELFFRGMVHESVQGPWGSKAATAVNACAFSAVHLLHHGLRWGPGGPKILVVSGLVWVVLMMILSWALTECRRRSGSIWPAVTGHAGFNLAMNLTIFWVLM